jgi:GTP-dependent dephospho-CoA kinase
VGTLYRAEQLHESEFLDALRSSPLVITVGDRVTESLQALGRTPDVQVVDEVERRVKRSAPDARFVRLLRAVNPAGTITLGAIEAVRNALEGEKPARVLIEGEEDLLAIPAIEAAPAGSTLFYGQPGEGVVMVRIDERAKASVKRTFARMKRE